MTNTRLLKKYRKKAKDFFRLEGIEKSNGENRYWISMPESGTQNANVASGRVNIMDTYRFFDISYYYLDDIIPSFLEDNMEFAERMIKRYPNMYDNLSFSCNIVHNFSSIYPDECNKEAMIDLLEYLRICKIIEWVQKEKAHRRFKAIKEKRVTYDI